MKNHTTSNPPVSTHTHTHTFRLKSSFVMGIVFSCFSSFSFAQNVNLTDSLVAHYSFSGNLNDQSGHNFNGTNFGGATLTTDRFGNANSAYLFDGLNDFMSFGNIMNVAVQTQVTFSAWFYLEPQGATNTFVGLGIGMKNTGTLQLRTRTEGLKEFQAIVADPFEQNTSYKISTTVQNGIWYHVLAIYQNNNIRLYVDNVLQSTGGQKGVGCFLNQVLPTSDLYVGAFYVDNNVKKFYKGKLDDIRIYNRGLNTAEITALFNEPNLAPTQLIVSDCSLSDVDVNQVLTADSVSGATTYQFRITNTTTGTTTVYSTANNHFTLAESGNTDFSTTYQVAVRYVIGSDTANYGAICEFTSFDINLQPQKDIFDRFGNKFTTEQISHGSCPPGWNTGNPDVTAGMFQISFCYDLATTTNPFTPDVVNTIVQAYTDIDALLTQNNCGLAQPIYVSAQAPLGMQDGNPGGASSIYIPEDELGASAAFNNSGILYGEMWRAINTGVNDPTLFDGFINLNFFSSTFTFNTDFSTPNSTLGVIPSDPNQVDLYSVMIHEILHSLGFASLIDKNGQSRRSADGWNLFSNFDIYLTSQTNGSLLNSVTPYNYQFGVPVTDMLSPPTALCGIIDFSGNFAINQPITDWDYAGGTALSHFDNNCYNPITDPHLIQGSISFGEENRSITAHEVNVLLDLGYSTTGNFGNGSLPQHVSGLPVNTTTLPIGIDDGGLNNPCSPRNLFELCTPGVESWTIAPLTNDVGAVAYTGLELTQGNGVLTDNGTTFTYMPNTAGEVIVRYIPVNANGDLGNITTVLIEITNCSATCHEPSICNLVCNSSIDHPGCTSNSCDWVFFGPPPNWNRGHGSPDTWNLGIPPPDPFSIRFRFNTTNGSYFKESGYTNVNVVANQNYIFSYYRKNEGVSTVNNTIQVFLATTAGIATAGYPLGALTTTTNNLIPISEKQLILEEQNIITSNQWEKVTVCFTADNNYDFLMFDGYAISLTGILIDRPELYPNDFGGIDITTNCGNIIVGNPVCNIPDASYSWNIQGDPTVIGTASQLSTNISQTTTFEGTISFTTNPTSTTISVPSTPNNCNVTQVINVSVTNTFATVLNPTDVSCFGSSDGFINSITTGGSTPYFYSWSNNTGNATTPNVSGLSAGVYNVTIVDNNFCATQNATTLTEPTPILTAIGSQNSSCNGSSNGSATATPSGGTPPYSFAWSNGFNGNPNTNLAAGTSTVTVTDFNLCTTTITTIITADPPLIVSLVGSVKENCTDPTTGSIDIEVTGGISPYTYFWSNGGGTQQDPSAIATGTYSVTVTDANGCEKMLTKKIGYECLFCNSFDHIIGDPNSITTITGNTTFSGNYIVNGDLYLKNGTFTLTPNTVFYMHGNGITDALGRVISPNIYLENTTFNMDDAKIVGDCNNMWGGIIATGGPNTVPLAPQYELLFAGDPSNPFPIDPLLLTGNTLNINGNLGLSEISDSYFGIMVNISTNNVYIDNTLFNNNLYHSVAISEFNFAGPYKNIPDFITSSTFNSDPQTMKFPYNKQSNFMQYYSRAAVDLSTVMSPPTISGNTINNHIFGVFSLLSVINATANIFNNPIVYGIYESGSFLNRSKSKSVLAHIENNTFNFSSTVVNTQQTNNPPVRSTIYVAPIGNRTGKFVGVKIFSIGAYSFLTNNNVFNGSSTTGQSGIDIYNTILSFSPVFEVQQNNLSNLDAAITIGSPYVHNVKVDKNTIQATKRGITISSNLLTQVRANHITAIPSSITENTYGIYALGANHLICKNNNIIGTGAVSPNPNIAATYGIIVETSGSGGSSRLFNNTIQATDIGVQTQGNNDNLKIKCNQLGTTTQGFGTTAWATLGLNGTTGTLRNQGSINCQSTVLISDQQSSAGNQWLTTNCNGGKEMIVQNVTPFDYWFNTLDESFDDVTKPICVNGSSNLQSCLNNATVNTCGAGSELQGLANPITDANSLAAANNALATAKANITTAQQGIDGGQTPALLDAIIAFSGRSSSNSQNSKLEQIKNTLLQNTPLSTPVLIAVLNENNVLPDEAVIRPVLKKNAPLNDAILTAALNRPTGLSDKTYKEIFKKSLPLSNRILLTLLDVHSILSGTTLQKILEKAAEKQTLSDAVLLAILARNPSLSDKTIKKVFVKSVPLSDAVLDVLQNQMQPPLPNSVLNPILQAHNEALNDDEEEDEDEDEDDEGEDNNDEEDEDEDEQKAGTIRDALEAEIAFNTQSVQEIESALVNFYLNTNDIAAAKTILQQSSFLASKKELVSIELSNNNFASAKNLLTIINQKGTIEGQNFVTLFTTLIHLKENNTELQNMNTNQEAALRLVANSGTLVATQAQNLLSLAFGDEFIHPIEKINTQRNSEKGMQYGYWSIDDEPIEISKNNFKGFQFKAYPIPSNGNITLEYYFEAGKTVEFRVHDVLGRLQQKIRLKTGHNVYQINDENFHHGLYLYELRVDGIIVKVEKLIILK